MLARERERERERVKVCGVRRIVVEQWRREDESEIDFRRQVCLVRLVGRQRACFIFKREKGERVSERRVPLIFYL